MEYSEYVDEPEAALDCQSCGCVFEDRQPWFYVEVDRRLRGNSGFDQDDCVSALATEQVCEPCLKKAMDKGLNFKYLSALDVDVTARQGLADSLSAGLPQLKTKHVVIEEGKTCSSCHCAISSGHVYVTVEFVGGGLDGGYLKGNTLALLDFLCGECAAIKGLISRCALAPSIAQDCEPWPFPASHDPRPDLSAWTLQEGDH